MASKKRKKRPEPALTRNSAGPMRDRRPNDHKRKEWLREE